MRMRMRLNLFQVRRSEAFEASTLPSPFENGLCLHFLMLPCGFSFPFYLRFPLSLSASFLSTLSVHSTFHIQS